MRINWKVRLKNPTFWATFAPTVVTFVYTVLELFGVVPKISKNEVMSAITAAISALAALGILVDPTTAGVGDSERAMTYNAPAKNSEESK